MSEETKGARRAKIERQQLVTAVAELKVVALKAKATWTAMRNFSSTAEHKAYYSGLIAEADAALDL